MPNSLAPKPIAHYLTVGGATVNVTEESAYHGINVPTETAATCTGCGSRHTEDWGWNFWANERGEEQPATYRSDGGNATPRAKNWAQTHAEKCRALPTN